MGRTKIRRRVRPNDRGIFAPGCYIAHQGLRYTLNQAAIDSLFSVVWVVVAPSIGVSPASRLLLYSSPDATSETFIGHADLQRD